MVYFSARIWLIVQDHILKYEFSLVDSYGRFWKIISIGHQLKIFFGKLISILVDSGRL